MVLAFIPASEKRRGRLRTDERATTEQTSKYSAALLRYAAKLPLNTSSALLRGSLFASNL